MTDVTVNRKKRRWNVYSFTFEFKEVTNILNNVCNLL